MPPSVDSAAGAAVGRHFQCHRRRPAVEVTERVRRPSKANPSEPIEVKPWPVIEMLQILINRSHRSEPSCFQRVTPKNSPIPGNCVSHAPELRGSPLFSMPLSRGPSGGRPSSPWLARGASLAARAGKKGCTLQSQSRWASRRRWGAVWGRGGLAPPAMTRNRRRHAARKTAAEFRSWGGSLKILNLRETTET